MIVAETKNKIINNYLGLLNSLSSTSKLELIVALSTQLKSDFESKPSAFKKSFGALKTKKSADEIINEIRKSRVSTRIIEEF